MTGQRYHVFLSHNSADKPAVERLALKLRAEGINPWLDEWNLIPGKPWQEEIETALSNCESCAVFFGPEGAGPCLVDRYQVFQPPEPASGRVVTDSRRDSSPRLLRTEARGTGLAAVVTLSRRHYDVSMNAVRSAGQIRAYNKAIAVCGNAVRYACIRYPARKAPARPAAAARAGTSARIPREYERSCRG